MHVFRFHIDFTEQPLDGSAGATVNVCSGAFAECTGLEATMEPKSIDEGGRNYGSVQRVGRVMFATVILKRGITTSSDLWSWFSLVNSGSFNHRRNAIITVFDSTGKGTFAWKLVRALPIKFKAADLNATNNEIGIEELHLVHEGLLSATPKERL
jgi:phage tail-like protein